MARTGRLDLMEIWSDAAALARPNRDALSAIAGMFLLLPDLLSGWLLPDRAPLRKGATLGDLIDANAAYVLQHWPVILIAALIGAFGSLTILVLLLDRARPSVAGAMRAAAPLLPIYILANVLQSALVLLGLLAFVVPGVYLAARFVCIAPAIAAERPANPVEALRRSLAATRGQGWRIILLLVIVFLVAAVAAGVATALTGIVATLLLPADLARFAAILVQALFETAIGVVILLIGAAIYRRE